MSAKQVVSPPRSQAAFVVSLHEVFSISTVSDKPSVLVLIPLTVFFCLFFFLQNMASEGSEERSVHAFVHWLIGELWV